MHKFTCTLYLKEWANEGVPITTTSDEASKMFDAVLSQVRKANIYFKIFILYIGYKCLPKNPFQFITGYNEAV